MPGAHGGRTIGRDRITYHFGPELAPVVEIEPGETVTFETLDASSGRIACAGDIPEYTRVRDPRRVNPATGPIAVRGAAPNDELRDCRILTRTPLGGWCHTEGAPGEEGRTWVCSGSRCSR